MSSRNSKQLYEKYDRWSKEENLKPETKLRYEMERDKHRASYDKARLGELKERLAKQGIDYEDWVEWANSLYVIEPSLNSVIVRSNAKDWDKIWEVDSHIDGLLKIEQLIGYKIHDRKRGRGDMEKDLES